MRHVNNQAIDFNTHSQIKGYNKEINNTGFKDHIRNQSNTLAPMSHNNSNEIGDDMMDHPSISSSKVHLHHNQVNRAHINTISTVMNLSPYQEE